MRKLLLTALFLVPQLHAMQMGDNLKRQQQNSCTQLATACCMGFLMLSKPVQAIYACSEDLSKGQRKIICYQEERESEDEQRLQYCNTLFAQEELDHAFHATMMLRELEFAGYIDPFDGMKISEIHQRNGARRDCRRWLAEREEQALHIE